MNFPADREDARDIAFVVKIIGDVTPSANILPIKGIY